METMSVSYAPSLVALSFAIAAVASYGSLDLAAKMRSSSGPLRTLWLVFAAVVLGVGIWSMHFVGMLSMQARMPISYDVVPTALSVLAAIVATGIAFAILGRGRVGVPQLLIGGTLMGGGVAAMHYMGMAAMRMPATISYDPLLFGVSIVIAVGASSAAMWIAYNLGGPRAAARGAGWLFAMRMVAALVMAVAVTGMHYTGMAAATFTAAPGAAAAGAVDTWLLGLLVTTLTFLLVFAAVMAATLTRAFGIDRVAPTA